VPGCYHCRKEQREQIQDLEQGDEAGQITKVRKVGTTQWLEQYLSFAEYSTLDQNEDSGAGWNMLPTK
jgi:hypothetical protein